MEYPLTLYSFFSNENYGKLLSMEYPLSHSKLYVHAEQRYYSEHRLPSFLRIMILHTKSSSTGNAQQRCTQLLPFWQ